MEPIEIAGTDIVSSRIGLGTWAIGGWMWGGTDEAESICTIRAAIDQGYHRAFTTIIDSNLTTIIAAVFLYQFGTGPVRGFAVTLFWGITANIFTAVLVTRAIFDYLTLKVGIKRLSI